MRPLPRQGGWYRRKSFAHFDRPLPYEAARDYVQNPKEVSRHPFWPFIAFEDTKRRFRTIDGKHVFDNKIRPLKYCAHRDGYVFAYYAYRLCAKYEEFIRNKSFSSAVIGYRAGKGTNITMAYAAFEAISKRKSCHAICIDIKSFFDNLDHATLKRNLLAVLGKKRLDEDWFKVFKAMTRYAWVDSIDLSNRLGYPENDPPRPLCSAAEFRSKVRSKSGGDIIKVNKAPYGIPQGSPLSSVLSNIHMLEFDERLNEYVRKNNGVYWRYSDDILVICRPDVSSRIQSRIKSEIGRLGGKLEISEEKTELSHFERRDSYLVCDRPVTYLGFTFDGARILLRGRTLSRFYRRLTYAARHNAVAARLAGAKKPHKRKLYREFSHLGQSNFYAYAKRASIVFKDKTPKRQLRKHKHIIHRVSAKNFVP